MDATSLDALVLLASALDDLLEALIAQREPPAAVDTVVLALALIRRFREQPIDEVNLAKVACQIGDALSSIDVPTVGNDGNRALLMARLRAEALCQLHPA